MLYLWFLNQIPIAHGTSFNLHELTWVSSFRFFFLSRSNRKSWTLESWNEGIQHRVRTSDRNWVREVSETTRRTSWREPITSQFMVGKIEFYWNSGKAMTWYQIHMTYKSFTAVFLIDIQKKLNRHNKSFSLYYFKINNLLQFFYILITYMKVLNLCDIWYPLFSTISTFHDLPDPKKGFFAF